MQYDIGMDNHDTAEFVMRNMYDVSSTIPKLWTLLQTSASKLCADLRYSTTLETS
jgi:hypothetical protein